MPRCRTKRWIEYRVGIHQGDIFGYGVNVAARLEGLTQPGGICVSARVQEDAAGCLDLAFAAGTSAALRNWAGQPDIAIEYLEAALRLSPRARIGTSLAIIGYAHFLGLRFDEAALKPILAIQEDLGYATPYRVLAACYTDMGRLDDAREIVAQLRAITPAVIPDAGYLRNAEHRELLLSGLRLAAGEALPPGEQRSADAVGEEIVE
jgi:tetratricopeptide (TPR) repeat protein